MVRVLIAGLIAMVVSIVIGPKFIEFMRRNELGQPIREDGPAGHVVKQGTPVMGGLLIMLCAFLPFFALSRYTLPALTVLFVTVGCGAIGFLDDFIKLRHRRSLGLKGRWKLLLLLAITVVVGFALRRRGAWARRSTCPSSTSTCPLSYFFYPFLFLVIAGAANGVNLTDGVDGLAAGTAIISLFTFLSISVIAYIRSAPASGERTDYLLDLSILAAALIGGAIGFLWYNSFPAEVFMGDTGSMALGGALAGFAIVTGTEALLRPDRGDLRRRRALGDHPGALLQVQGQARLPDRAAPAPLRDEGVVGDEDHGPLLDRRGDPLHERLRPLLPLLPPVPAVSRLVPSGCSCSAWRGRVWRRRRRSRRAASRSWRRIERSATTASSRCSTASTCWSRARGCRARRRSSQPRASAGFPVWSEIELASRLLENPDRRRHRDEREDDDDGAARGDARRADRGQRRHGALRACGGGARRRGPATQPIVCELSSFQLEDIETFRPWVAVLLNLEPDHLDRHGDFDAYRAAKLRIFENQTSDDVAIVPRGFGPIPGEARRVEFSADDELPAEPLIPGAHNRENAAAATAAARAAGLSDDAIAEALRTFPGVPHRLELVAERGGVRYVNDSKATNTAAARRALTAFDAPLHLILGGSLKGERFDAFAQDVARANVATAYLIGEAAEPLAGRSRLRGRAVPLLDDARTGCRGGRRRGTSG